MVPKWLAISFVSRVVENNEVADVLGLAANLFVVLRNGCFLDERVRKQEEEPHNSVLNHVDACGLKRLNKAAR